MADTMFPSVVLDLDGPDGNVYAVISAVKLTLKTARRQGATHLDADAIVREMMSSPSYDAVLDVASRYITLRGADGERAMARRDGPPYEGRS